MREILFRVNLVFTEIKNTYYFTLIWYLPK